jgi:hypothetical protein
MQVDRNRRVAGSLRGQFYPAVHALMGRPDAHPVPAYRSHDMLVRLDDGHETVAVEQDSTERDSGSHRDHCSWER